MSTEPTPAPLRSTELRPTEEPTQARATPGSAGAEAPPVRLVGGRYRVEQLLGRGGMGSVWSGRHTSLGQLVAVKFIHPELARSELARRRFETEARAAARIQSRHAVAVHDHGLTDDGQPYIVMEHLEGESLDARIRRKGALPLPEVTEIVRQAAKALAVAHEAGIVHRDLKPENVFLARDRDSGKLGYTVKLVDFGIAKMVHEEAEGQLRDSQTQAGSIVGTPHFMAPEVLTEGGGASAVSDIWSLGACAYTAAVGELPFDGDAIGEVVLKVCALPLPVPSARRSGLPVEFDRWFAKVCHRDPKQRFQSAKELVDALAQLATWSAAQKEVESFQLRPASALDFDLEPPRTTGRGMLIMAVLGGASLAVLGLGYYVYQHTEAANRRAAESAASARAAIEEANRRTREASERSERANAEAEAEEPAASAPAPSASSTRRPSRR